MFPYFLILIFSDASATAFTVLDPTLPGMSNLAEKQMNITKLWSPPSELKIKFLLFTPINPFEKEEIRGTSESIRMSSFNPGNPTTVLIHGYRSNLDGNDTFFVIKDALLKENLHNVIIVDWTEHNSGEYGQAVVNGKVVGSLLANFLKLIMEVTGTQAQDIHLIGQSLGSHIAGWAGKKIPGLGRITGLDPARHLFLGAEKAEKLDASDALFVDIIHSNGGDSVTDGLGMNDQMGHMDFYPNGGKRQPGCSNDSSDWLFDNCDHERAVSYFLESIDDSECRFLAAWCKSYEDFQEGECVTVNSALAEMGFHAKRIAGLPLKSRFFLRTNEDSPFCLGDDGYTHTLI